MVKQVSAETVTAGGIVIPDKFAAKHRQARGKVEIAGKDNKYVQEGDEVLFSKENCFTETVEDEYGKKVEYVLVKEEDIFLVTNRDCPDL